MNVTAARELILDKPLPPDQDPAAVYISSLPSLDGQRVQMQALEVIAQMCNTDVAHMNWGELRYEQTVAIRAKLAQRYRPATANRFLSALRQTLKQAWLLEHMSVEAYSRATGFKPVQGETLPAGRELTMGEIEALITTCQEDSNRKAGTRDTAIIGTMYAAGLRRAEVTNLLLSSYDFFSGQIALDGKYNRQRTAYLTQGAADALNDWLSIRGSQGKALFVPINKGRILNTSASLCPQAIYWILFKRAQQAGVKSFTPHDLRRTFIGHLLDAGVDIATISKMVGHRDVKTTARYDRRSEEIKRRAANLLYVPYHSLSLTTSVNPVISNIEKVGLVG